MAQKTVLVSKTLPLSATAVWAIARQFCKTWHPFLEWVNAERDEAGHLVRCFKVKGEEGLYRERLTYFSNTEFELRYVHLEGIKDVTSYAATFRVVACEEGCTITWQAILEADEPRASAIASGTQIVFEAGIATLEEQASLRAITISGTLTLAGIASATKPGPLVIFLHGIGGNKGNWESQIAAASLHFQAVAIDLRGYGGSALGAKQSTIDDYCNDILLVMAQFEKSHVILCGLSLGSWIATSFAMRHPEKLSGLILSGGCTGMSEAPDAEREAFLAARQKPLDAGLSPRDFADQVVNVIAGPNATADIRESLRASMAAIPAPAYRDALNCFANPQERFDFSRIACPVLMMTGEHDRLASPTEIQGVANRIHDASAQPDVQFEIITGAGHLCNMENPELYNANLTRFLRKLTR
jgi:pimeloyl-ACP methyl ester carboxylesterase